MNNPYQQNPQQFDSNRNSRNERWSADDNRGSQTWREDNSNREQNRSSWNTQQGYGSSRYSPNFAGQSDYSPEWQNNDNYDDYSYRSSEFGDQQHRTQWGQEYSPYSGQEYSTDFGSRQNQSTRSEPQRWEQEQRWSNTSSRQQQPWQGRQAPVTNQFGGNQYLGNPFSRRQESWSPDQFNRGGQGYGAQRYDNNYGYERPPYPASSGDAQSSQPTGAYGLEQASHRGKGPKGYTRTDERIREEICECLSDDHRIDATDISVQVKEGVVTLEGSVFDRTQKHRAEDIADRCSGVKDVHNSLRVTQHANQLANNEKGDKSAGKSH